MKQAYLIKQGVEEFALAREQFAVIVAQLQSAVVLGMEHGEVEKLVWREGTELLRRLVQAHFDVRTGKEKREAGVRGADGVMRSQVRQGCPSAHSGQSDQPVRRKLITRSGRN